MKLRPYQEEAIGCIKKHFETEDKQFICMPTGSGKTITFLKYARENFKNVLVIVPSKEILKQVSESALILYNPWEISLKGANHDERPWEEPKKDTDFETSLSKIHICIINSIRGNYREELADQEFDLIVIDEAHHVQAESYKKFLDLIEKLHYQWEYVSPKVLGVTATPDRRDGKLIKEMLHTCTFEITISELIRKKYLSDMEGYTVKTKIDLLDVPFQTGDFSTIELYKILSTDSRNGIILDICKKEFKNRKTLIFCINVQHSKEINKLLNSNGLSSRHIDGRMNSKERNVILSAFREGNIDFLCNCQLLSEGFDEPSIDGVILARPTMSRSLFIQMIGRGLRIFPGKKNCKIVDIVDHHKNLINFNDIIPTNKKYRAVEKFESFEKLNDYIRSFEVEAAEFRIERADFFNEKLIDNIFAYDHMLEYLDKNNIKYFQPISFDEASFLIWMNELKREYANGKH